MARKYSLDKIEANFLKLIKDTEILIKNLETYTKISNNAFKKNINK